MGRGLAAGTEREKPADRGHERIATRIDHGRNAQRHLRTQRKPPAWKFLSCLLPEYLHPSGMGAQAGEGPYRIAQASPRAGWRWRELDCANSSDALLMNIF